MDRIVRTAERHRRWLVGNRYVKRPPDILPSQFRAARLAAGLSQRQVAAHLGVTHETWRNWEYGKCAPARWRIPALLAWVEARLSPRSTTTRRAR